MITDQKTQNRLHADTGTELFSIRQRKEAVTRMLEFGRIGKFHELTPGSDGKLYSGRIQVRTEIRHD